MSQAVARAVYAQMIANVGDTGTNPLKAAVSNRIYAIEAPASSTLPLVVWTMDDPVVTGFFGGKTRLTATFTVSVFDKADVGADSVAGIEEKVFARLHDAEVAVTGYDRGSIQSTGRGAVLPEGDYLRADSTFQIVATESS